MSISFSPVRTSTLALSLLAAIGSTTALAQGPDIELYGNIDLYLNHMRSSSGTSITAMEDGAMLRSRLGVKGRQELDEGRYYIGFQLEMGVNVDDGARADAGRTFDRQSWIALGSDQWGELRVGRQPSIIFKRGDYIDASSRTLGSMVNNFGVPSRYDNDIAYISPRRGGFLFEAHYALAETGSATRQGIYQAGVDYLYGPWRFGYAGLFARAPDTAVFTRDMYYHNGYANYEYGRGKVYLTWVRSNNNTAGAAGNNAGAIVNNIGGVLAGTNPDINGAHDVLQISADYRVREKITLGAIAGVIEDRQTGSGRDANGASLFVYYDWTQKTRLYAITEYLDNQRDAGFRPASSAGIKSNFSHPADVNGQTLKGIQFGIRHRF